MNSTINFIIEILPSLQNYHSRTSSVYQYLEGLLSPAVDDLFGANGCCNANLIDVGNLCFPYFSMGAINSTPVWIG